MCDIRADVYSLGLTLYELLALKAAFDETDRFELIERIQHEEPDRLRKVNSRIPIDLETVIHKAVAQEPARRYATPRDLADDLRRFLRGEPVQARRIGPLGRACEVDKAASLADNIGLALTRRIDSAGRLFLLAQHSTPRRGRAHAGERRTNRAAITRSSRDCSGDARPSL